MLSGDKFFEQCRTTIQKLEENNKIAVISNLAVMETIHAIRKRIADDMRQTEDMEDAKNNTMSESKRVVEQFIRYVSRLQDRGNTEMIKPGHAVADHHQRVCSKLYRYAGQIKYINKSRKYRYAGLGHVDMEHAFLASDAGVGIFCSTDGGFADLEADPDFSHMTFDILKPPKQ